MSYDLQHACEKKNVNTICRQKEEDFRQRPSSLKLIFMYTVPPVSLPVSCHYSLNGVNLVGNILRLYNMLVIFYVLSKHFKFIDCQPLPITGRMGICIYEKLD